jgi:DNA-directed RNA polymerase specialized sigma24 family protein
MDEWTLLLMKSLTWLRGRCIQRTRTRSGLSAEDLEQEVVARYFETAAEWFAEEETRDPLARCRALLSFRILNVVTEYDRRIARQMHDTGAEAGDRLDRVPSPEPDATVLLLGHEARGFLRALSNATYRLVFTAAHMAHEVVKQDFTAPKLAVRRPVPEAWALFERERTGPDQPEAVWKRTVAQIIRCTAALRPPIDDGEREHVDVRAARSWFEKNLQRARAALLAEFSAVGA